MGPGEGARSHSLHLHHPKELKTGDYLCNSGAISAQRDVPQERCSEPGSSDVSTAGCHGHLCHWRGGLLGGPAARHLPYLWADLWPRHTKSAARSLQLSGKQNVK